MALADTNASEILEQAWQAVGGDAWRRIVSLRRETELFISGSMGRTVTYWAAPDKFCHLGELGGMVMRVATDGVSGWTDDLPVDATAVRNWRTYAWLISNRCLTPGAVTAARYLGRRQVDGREADTVELLLPFDATVTCSFDRESRFLVREFSHHSAPGIDNVWLESFYADYQRVGDVMVPFRCGEIVPGSARTMPHDRDVGGFVAELRVTSFILNDTVPEDAFAPSPRRNTAGAHNPSS